MWYIMPVTATLWTTKFQRLQCWNTEVVYKTMRSQSRFLQDNNGLSFGLWGAITSLCPPHSPGRRNTWPQFSERACWSAPPD